ncbi:uncharacterized protein LOC121733737 [Aricia agestis]|uniref:uncharacterized protein LOC121733737 n=1 Tax=Aricia agestis TaxID=91739 RepID=UPI001C20A246|nr:uncharacterized protein LOC121733737 [Aricia agestis]
MNMDSLKQSINQMSELFNNKMTEFQQELNSCQPSSTTSALASEFSTFKSFVLEALKSLQSQIEVLVEVQDQNEMRRRKKILLLHGVSEAKKTELEVVQTIFSTQLRLPEVDITAVKYCHRLGKVNESKPRPILIKFHDSAIRNKVWAAKTNLKNSGITMTEFLIKKRHDVFMMARQRFGITKCWTNNGSVLVIAPDGSKVRVHSMADLDAISGSHSSDNNISSVNMTRGTAGTKTKRLAKK